MRLEIAAALQMRRAATAAAPNEACGLLFGGAGFIGEATLARNIAAEPRRRFEIDPAHLFDAHRRDRAGPMRLIGCWHSHPDGSAQPSRYDREGVTDMGWLWLIVAEGEIRAWRPVAGGFEPVAMLECSL